MNGPATSIVGSIGVMLAGVIVGWLSNNHIIPAADVDQATAVIGTILVGLIGTALVIFKGKMATVQSHMAAVNATGTVKAVDATAAAPMLAAPPTSDDAKIAAVNAIEGIKVVPQGAPTAQVNAVPPAK